MPVEQVKRAYEKHPATFNIGLPSVIGAAAVAIAFYIGAQLSAHSIDHDAHPDLRAGIHANGEQLNRIEANQVAEQIEKLDERICIAPDDANLRRRMRELLSDYQKLMGESYPTFLLRCTNA